MVLVAAGPKGLECFLGKRKNSGTWSLMGGGIDPADNGNLRATAFRELAEEAWTLAGPLMLQDESAYPVADTLSIDAPGYHWETYIVQVSREEFGDIRLDPKEFTCGQWFAVDSLPPGTHRLLKWPFLQWPDLSQKLVA